MQIFVNGFKLEATITKNSKIVLRMKNCKSEKFKCVQGALALLDV